MVQDFYGRILRDLRISVMDRCNFRCPYCMPQGLFPEDFNFLPASERMSFEEILKMARVSVRLGVRKIRLTGGEPLLRPHLPDLIARLKEIEGIEDIALTTNGFLLAKRVESLKKAGLDRVTISLDALEPDIFFKMSGGHGALDAVLEGIWASVEAGFPKPIKVNSVICRHKNESQIKLLSRYFRHSGVIVRFIEYMDVGTRNGWDAKNVVSVQEIKKILEEESPLEPLMAEYYGEVARRYRYCDGGGEIGLIGSVTEAFCGTCSRARLSSDGIFYTCLFASKGTKLRDYLQKSVSDEALEAHLRFLWGQRKDRYSQERAYYRENRRPYRPIEMNYIGG